MKRLLILSMILLTTQVMGCGWFTALKNKFSRNRVQPIAPAAPSLRLSEHSARQATVGRPVAPASTLRARLSKSEREQLAQDIADAHRAEFAQAILKMEAAKKRFPQAH
jgi:hypothetical protein